MKAVLVINIDDSLIEGDERFAVDGYLMQESDCVGCYEAVGRIRNAVLKPMPQAVAYEMTDTQTIKAVKVDNGFRLGWNACLEKITGETE